MRRLFLIFTAFSVGVLANAQPVLVHTHEMMNRRPVEKYSHLGLEKWSSLEPIHAQDTIIPTLSLLPYDLPEEQNKPFYPRIKALHDGRYIMFWQGGQTSSRVYYAHSSDLLHWGKPVRMYGPHQVQVEKHKPYRRYMTSDAVVLKTGEIVNVTSFRSDMYDSGKGCGIMISRSRYNGDEWNNKAIIYEGPNWEPYLLELPDGTLQCYFTDARPQTASSGTSMIESYDNGYTWTKKKRVCRQFKYYHNDEKVYTDQMPSFRVLSDGRTVFGFLEARLEPGGYGTGSSFAMSMVYNDAYEWKNLLKDEEGPSEKKTNAFTGSAGYVSTFPSGEVVISCGIGRLLSLKVGDGMAQKFNGKNWESDWLRPLAHKGLWGSTEVIDPHHIAWTMECDEGIQIGVGYLNHAVQAVRQQVCIDGNGNEWEASDALFIGSDSPVETVFRACYDSDNLYILAESVDDARGAVVNLVLHNAAAKKFAAGSSVGLTVDAAGLVASDGFSKSEQIPGLEVKVREGRSVKDRKGFVAEISVPLSALGVSEGSDLSLFAEISTPSGVKDTFFGINRSKPDTWQRIQLK